MIPFVLKNATANVGMVPFFQRTDCSYDQRRIPVSESVDFDTKIEYLKPKRNRLK